MSGTGRNRWLRFATKALERCGLKRRPRFLCVDPDYAHIEAGAFSYGRPLIMGADGTAETKVTIGKFCSIADGVRILLRANHRLEAPTTYPLTEILGIQTEGPYARCRGPVTLGNDVWVGQDALIMGGVTVGDGAVIGARSLVTCDVPPYGIVAGNPARLKRKRFDDATIARLLAIRWWDWPEARVREHAALLAHGPIEAFLRVAEQAGR